MLKSKRSGIISPGRLQPRGKEKGIIEYSGNDRTNLASGNFGETNKSALKAQLVKGLISIQQTFHKYTILLTLWTTAQGPDLRELATYVPQGHLSKYNDSAPCPHMVPSSPVPTASVISCPPQSKNTKWESPEINDKL